MTNLPTTAAGVTSRPETASDGVSGEEGEILKITINTLLGGVFMVEVDPATHVVQLKEMLFHMQGIPVQQQSLVFRQQVLPDHVCLCDTGVRDGSALKLVLGVTSALTNIVATPDTLQGERARQPATSCLARPPLHPVMSRLPAWFRLFCRRPSTRSSSRPSTAHVGTPAHSAVSLGAHVLLCRHAAGLVRR